jgi:hypothetical protein
MQSVPFNTKVVSLNPADGEVYSIQHYVLVCQRFVTGQWFSPVTPVSLQFKIDLFDIAKIMLQMVLNTITLT